ncbi:MAG: phosphoribosyltransferase family protein, partial [Patescibacteria group bacterium]
RVLYDSKCIEVGHFARADFCHTDRWIRKDQIYSSPLLLAVVAEEIALRLFALAKGKPIDVVVAPPVGAVALASSVAAHLTWLQKRVKDEVRMVFPREVSIRDGKGFQFTGSFSEIIAGKTIALVDAVASTGGIIRSLEKATGEAGANLIFSGVIWVSSEYRATMDFTRSISLAHCESPSWLASSCPICFTKELPLNTIYGYGSAYFEMLKKADLAKQEQSIGRCS